MSEISSNPSFPNFPQLNVALDYLLRRIFPVFNILLPIKLLRKICWLLTLFICFFLFTSLMDPNHQTLLPRSKLFKTPTTSNMHAYLAPKVPTFPGRHNAQLQASYKAFLATNSDLGKKEFDQHWTSHIFTKTGLNLNFHEGQWSVEDSLMTNDLAEVAPVTFLLLNSKRPRPPQSNDSDHPNSSHVRISSPDQAVPSTLFPTSPPTNPPHPEVVSITPSQLFTTSSLSLVYNAISQGARLSGLVPISTELGKDEFTIEISGQAESLQSRWNNHHLVTYPLEFEDGTRRSHLLLPTGEMAVKLSKVIPKSTILSFETVGKLNDHIRQQCDGMEVILIANFSTDKDSGAWQSDAFSTEDLPSDILNLTTMNDGLLLFLPIKSAEECGATLAKLSYLSINGRKDPTNRQRITKICKKFREVKLLTNLSFSYIIWHTDTEVLKAVPAEEIFCRKAIESEAPTPSYIDSTSEESKSTLLNLREGRKPVTYTMALSSPAPPSKSPLSSQK